MKVVGGSAQKGSVVRRNSPSRGRRGRSIASGRQWQGALAAVLALYVIGALRYGPPFAFGTNLTNLLADDAKYALVALGMSFVILAGGIDLSVGSVALVGGVIAGMLSDRGPIVAFGAAMLLGLGIGSINGALIAKVRLEPFIVTLATLLTVRGLGLLLSTRRAVVASNEAGFMDVVNIKLVGLALPVWLVLGLFTIAAFIQRYSGFGRSVMATGGNEQAARLMGVSVDRTKLITYVISGGLSALAGALLTAQSGSIATSAGTGWELSAIAAVVVGGILLTGGVGNILGALIGVVLLQMVFNVIIFENGRGGIQISPYWESVIRGFFLLVVVLLQVRLTKTSRS